MSALGKPARRTKVVGGSEVPVCGYCGALVGDEAAHEEWHRRLNDRLTATAKGRGW